MSFALLEAGAVLVTLFMALEMYRQRVPWRSALLRCVVALAVLTVMIALWRGL